MLKKKQEKKLNELDHIAVKVMQSLLIAKNGVITPKALVDDSYMYAKALYREAMRTK